MKAAEPYANAKAGFGMCGKMRSDKSCANGSKRGTPAPAEAVLQPLLSALCTPCLQQTPQPPRSSISVVGPFQKRKVASAPNRKKQKKTKKTKTNSAMQQPQEEERARQREQNAPQTKSMALPLLSSHPHLTTEVIQEQLDINRTLIEVGTRAKQQNPRHDEKSKKAKA